LPGPEEKVWAGLNAQERKDVTGALADLARAVNVAPPLPDTAEGLLEAIDGKLGTPDPRRDTGPISEQGPTRRMIRVLLWKHGVKEYNDTQSGYTPRELVQKLQQQVTAGGAATNREP
jgi:hypothetical protein